MHSPHWDACEGTPMGDSNPRDQNPQLGAEIRAVVERQLQQPDLEEVNEAVDRLTEQGHSREQAIDAVGAVLLEEMQEMMTETESFDRTRYLTRLRNL
jgi:hypothetical protein